MPSLSSRPPATIARALPRATAGTSLERICSAGMFNAEEKTCAIGTAQAPIPPPMIGIPMWAMASVAFIPKRGAPNETKINAAATEPIIHGK